MDLANPVSVVSRREGMAVAQYLMASYVRLRRHYQQRRRAMELAQPGKMDIHAARLIDQNGRLMYMPRDW